MRILTESGTIYILEDRTLTRFSEEPIFSYKENGYVNAVFNREPLDWWDDPIVGQRMAVKFVDYNPSTLLTSRIVRITEDTNEFVFTPFERAER